MARQIVPNVADPQPELYKLALADFKAAKTARTPKDEGAVKKLAKKIDDNLQQQWVHFYAGALRCRHRRHGAQGGGPGRQRADGVE